MVATIPENPLFREHNHEASERSVPEQMHAEGVALAFNLENALFASVLGKENEATTALRAADIDPSQLTVDYVSGFVHVMNAWAAEVAAASLPNPETLAVPQLPEESLLAHVHPPLFAELGRLVASGVRHGVESAPLVRQELAQDPTGLTYIVNRLREEEAQPVTHSLHTRRAELQGMTKAVHMLEGISKHMTNPPPSSSRTR